MQSLPEKPNKLAISVLVLLFILGAVLVHAMNRHQGWLFRRGDFANIIIKDTLLERSAKLVSKAFIEMYSPRNNPSTILDQRAYYTEDTTHESYIRVQTYHQCKKDSISHVMIQTLNRKLEVLNSYGY